MRESMDEMLQRVRDYVFQTDEALKESQRSISRDGAVQLETTALKEIRDDIWALEDKVRAAKWARSPTEQAELANQIDPLMLQVMAKCQQHKDQVKGCQGLLTDIVSWCERGTSAYRFAVHESAVNRAGSRYSSGGGADNTAQGKSAPASRIPQYKSPTKQPKGQAASQQQVQVQLQAQQSAQQQQLLSIKQSRIPQPTAAARKSLPDAEQAGSSPDQLILQAERDRRSSSNSSSGGAAVTDSASSAQGSSNNTDGGGLKPQGVAASRIAAFQRSAAAAVTATAASSTGSAAARGSGGLVAAAAAAFEGGKPAGPTHHARSFSSGGGEAPAAAAAAALRSAPVESFVPLDLESDEDEDGVQLLQPLAQRPKPLEQQEEPVAPRVQERLSHSGSSNGSLAGRGSAGRLPSRSLLQLEPSRDDVPLSSATQLRQQPAAEKATAAVPAPAAVPAAPQAAASGPTGHAAVPSLRLSSSLHHESQSRSLQQLKVPRPSYTSDTTAADSGSSANDFPEFGPLHSFTPLVSQQFGRSHPFAAGSSSSNGYGMVDRSSLRNSQDISMLLRSGMLVEAALLSSNASRMHVIHDAVAKKPAKPEGEPEVPLVPARLAVHKKRPWWAQAARVVVGTAAMAVAGAAGAATAKHIQGGEEGAPGMLRPRSGTKGSRGSKQQQSMALEEAGSQLPFVPMGPAPDASAGCG